MKTELKTVNSLVMARFITGKPNLSAKLEKQHERICWANSADRDAVGAPPARLFGKGGPITQAFAIINSMAKVLKEKGMPIHNMKGMTYQKTSDIDTIQSEFDRHRDQLDEEIAKIRFSYEGLVGAGKKRLGNLVNEIEYPPVEEFLSDFTMELKWMAAPVQVGDDVLGAVSTEVAARIRAASSEDDMLAASHGRYVEDAVNEMTDIIKALLDGKRLRQERIDKLITSADTLQQKNWLNLPQLTDLANTLRDLHVDTDVIPDSGSRTTYAARIEDAKKSAEKILADLGI